MARVVVSVLLPPRPVARLAAQTTRGGRSAASPRRSSSARSPSARSSALSVQLGAAARRGRRRARHLRQEHPHGVRRVHPLLRAAASSSSSSSPRPRTARAAPTSASSRSRRPTGVVRLGPMICYEDIFPSFGAPARQARPEHPHQHHQRRLVRRAPRSRTSTWRWRSIARSSRASIWCARSTPASAPTSTPPASVYDKSPSVDPDETPDAKPVALLDDVAVLQPFKLYATLGEWFGGLCLLAAIVLGLLARARGGRPVRWRLVGGRRRRAGDHRRSCSPRCSADRATS